MPPVWYVRNQGTKSVSMACPMMAKPWRLSSQQPKDLGLRSSSSSSLFGDYQVPRSNAQRYARYLPATLTDMTDNPDPGGHCSLAAANRALVQLQLAIRVLSPCCSPVVQPSAGQPASHPSILGAFKDAAPSIKPRRRPREGLRARVRSRWPRNLQVRRVSLASGPSEGLEDVGGPRALLPSTCGHTQSHTGYHARTAQWGASEAHSVSQMLSSAAQVLGRSSLPQIPGMELFLHEAASGRASTCCGTWATVQGTRSDMSSR